MVFCSEDHKYSPGAPQHGDLCPCCTGRAVSLVSGSLCLVFGVRLWRTILRIFLGFRKYLRIQYPPVRQWYMSASVYEASGRISHVLYVKVAGPAVLSCRRGEDTRGPTVAAR